jgi:hypothetical protein
MESTSVLPNLDIDLDDDDGDGDAGDEPGELYYDPDYPDSDDE